MVSSAVFPAKGSVQADSLQTIHASTPRFRVGEADISPMLPALGRVGEQADSLMGASGLKAVRVTARTSADGPVSLNDSLAHARAAAVASWLSANTSVPVSLIETGVYLCSWQDVDTLIRTGGFSSAYRGAVLQTISRGGTQMQIQSALKRLSGGEAWKWLASDVLPLQRSAVIDLVGDRTFTTVIRPGGEMQTAVTESPDMEVAAEMPVAVSGEVADGGWRRHMYLKTNIPAWGMLWVNAAVEVDVVPHWSFTLPVYYSGMNYFTGHTKFRTLALQPEVRWWPRKENTGFFAGAHFGLGWYDVAFGGDYRYQDHLRRTPAVGGGVAAGYRFHFCRNRRWQMEASLGFGVYRLDYDLFQNHADGLLVGRRQRTFYGVDQAAFTISYRFDLGKKKGGER